MGDRAEEEGEEKVEDEAVGSVRFALNDCSDNSNTAAMAQREERVRAVQDPSHRTTADKSYQRDRTDLSTE